MKASKTLASAVAAAAVVGLVYAQTPDTAIPPATPDSSQTLQNQGTTSPGSMQTPATPDMAAVPAERPAQADRN